MNGRAVHGAAGRRPHPVPAGRRLPRHRDRAGRTADRPEDERGPRVRAAAAGTGRVLPPGRARHHRQTPATPFEGPRRVHLRGAPGALRLDRQAEDAGAMGRRSTPWTWQPSGCGTLGRRRATTSERRAVRVMNAHGHIAKRFPHARQVALIERYVTRTVREKERQALDEEAGEVRRSTCSSSPAWTPARPHRPIITGYVRGHWTIENKVHWVRDVHAPRGFLPRPERPPAKDNDHAP